MDSKTLSTASATGYALIDSGNEEKLERFGDVVLARPDPQALWEKNLPKSEWDKAHGRYERKGKSGVWHGNLPKSWNISFGGASFIIKPTSFKHVGVFPEQQSNWEWSESLIRGAGRPISVLNLFAYTGGATMAAARAGASVVHLDASKAAVEWAKENASLSGLSGSPIRYILDDVLKFCEREVKRGNTYDAIIMDPPAFGHGPHDEVWKIEEHFLKLLSLAEKLLSNTPLFVLLNGYAEGYSPLVFSQNLEWCLKKHGGSISRGELTIAEEGSERLLPAGMYARWNA